MKYYLFSKTSSWCTNRRHRNKLKNSTVHNKTPKELQILYFNGLNVLIYNIRKVNMYNFKNIKNIK